MSAFDEKTAGPQHTISQVSDEDRHGISSMPEIVVHEGSGKTLTDGAKAREVANAELYAAIQESPIKKFSRSSLHLYFSCFVAFCCACANGYDGSLIGAIIAMPHFQSTFGTGYDGQQVSIIAALYSVGSIVTSPLGAIVADRFGRRMGMLTGGCIIIAGAILTATASTFAQLVVGRFVLGSGIQVMTCAAPAYSIEIAPPHWRGRFTGFYNCGWFGGCIPASLIVFGTSYIDNDYQWKVPLLLQCFACLVVISSVWFIPESPRWQMANGKEEQAVAFLVYYHGNGNEASRLVQLELEEMREGIRQDGIDKRPLDYRPLFATHAGRWRMVQVLFISIFGQFSGNGLGYFNPTIFKGLGITSVQQQLGYNLLSNFLSCLGAAAGVCLSDTMPRRKVLVIGTFMCAVWLAVNAGCSAGLNNDEAANGGVLTNLSLGQAALAFYFLFNITYSFTYTPLQGIIPAESLETTMRAKGLAASGFIVGIMGFINQYAGPVALQNIGYRYIYIFVAWDVIESVLWYLFGVESQGRTLEQLAWVYDQKNPVKASKTVDKIVVQADGKVTEKIIDNASS